MHHTPHVLLEGAKSEVYFHDSAHLLRLFLRQSGPYPGLILVLILRSLLVIVIFVNFLCFTPFLNILIPTTSHGLFVQNNFQLRTVFGQNLSPTLLIFDNKPLVHVRKC